MTRPRPAAEPKVLSRFERISRLWRTLQPLPPIMHVHRLSNEVRKRAWRRWLPTLVTRWRRDSVDFTVFSPGMQRLGQALAAAPALDASSAQTGHLVAAGRTIASLPPTSWTLTEARPLEVYEAHYLGWAEALISTGRACDLALCWRSVESWHQAAAALRQPWEPYPRARRALTCLRAAARLHGRDGKQAALLQRWLIEIALTAALPLPWLLERHLGANHLLVNLLALEATLAATGGTTTARAATGHELLRVWQHQFLPDGSHMEGAPMYHALLLEDALTLHYLRPATHDLAEPIAQATAWLKAMQHPDGSLPAFGDTDPTVISTLPLLQDALKSAAPGLPDPSHSAWVATAGEGRVVVHVGHMAATEQPGHAHCDGLSVEYVVSGLPVLCDAGLSGYERDPMRPWNRSEAAHSVVAVAGQPQLELWGAFRLGARGESHVLASGVIHGWRWLGAALVWPGQRYTQLRLVALAADGSLYLIDGVSGPSRKTTTATQTTQTDPAIQLRLRLHESVVAQQKQSATAHDPPRPPDWQLRRSSQPAATADLLQLQSTHAFTVEPSRRFPTRGAIVDTMDLVTALNDGEPAHVLLSGQHQLDGRHQLNSRHQLAEVQQTLATGWAKLSALAARHNIR